jgi:hypothetical protein
MRQWHPVFAQLLRQAVESYYDVQTTVPVGDAPREADFVLLRRTSQATPPFRGLWRHLTAWNIVEFKGPTVSPRASDIERLVELGLGVDRRLNEERTKQGQRAFGNADVSFWYIANRLGARFIGQAERKLRGVNVCGPGLWRSVLLGRLIYLVSSSDLPIEEDSLPLHIVGIEPIATEREVVRLVLEQPILRERYGGWLASLHPQAWREAEAMARATKRQLVLDIRPAIEFLGWDEVIKQLGIERVIEHLGSKEVIDRLGPKEVIKQIGLDNLLANLSPAERRELKRRLEK